jgi:hypothetical protein
MSNPLPPFDAPGVPAPIKNEMLDLRHHLDGKIPPKRDGVSNLLIATWNLKAFASLTETWTAGPNQSPKRDWRALWAITEIISRFDVIALQEVKGDLKAAHHAQDARRRLAIPHDGCHAGRPRK